MIAIWRPLLAVPVIALLNGMIAALGDTFYALAMDQTGNLSWPNSFWIVLPVTALIALMAGAILAPIVYFLGRYIPEPKMIYLIFAGIVMGPIPYLIADGFPPMITSLIIFAALGALSGFMWWYFVERYRPSTNG